MLATHDLPPIYDEHSQVLILGTMPSPKSKEAGFYYAHPQNRFWKVLSAVFQTEIPLERSGRIAFLLEKHIALWDVIAQCEIDGAKDASIRTVVANDLPFLLQRTQIHTVFYHRTNGDKMVSTAAASANSASGYSFAILQPGQLCHTVCTDGRGIQSDQKRSAAKTGLVLPVDVFLRDLISDHLTDIIPVKSGIFRTHAVL